MEVENEPLILGIRFVDTDVYFFCVGEGCGDVLAHEEDVVDVEGGRNCISYCLPRSTG